MFGDTFCIRRSFVRIHTATIIFALLSGKKCGESQTHSEGYSRRIFRFTGLGAAVGEINSVFIITIDG